MERYSGGNEVGVNGSYIDHLTGLPTMTWFFELADAGCKELISVGKVPAVLFFDLSGMKSFNHKYGFVEGDNILKEFARLLESIYGKDKCSRFVQDHFVVYTEKSLVDESVQTVFTEWKNLSKKKALPVRTGVYIIDTPEFEIVTACDNAKVATDLNRNTFVSGINYFNKELEADLEKRDYIISNLDRAIAEKWIRVYYQPIIRTINGKVCDEEALSRWIDPVKGFLSPADFIGILEESHLIYKLDLYVVDEIIKKINTMKNEGMNAVPQSVNLSRIDFEECDIVDEICKKMDNAGLDHSLITIEITESIVASDFDYMKTQIERFRNLGFKVWMDDFGSGYSSLDLLQELSFDLIKFDMRFLRQVENGANGKIILTELMRMATALGLETVCEGVESAEHVKFLGDIGCCKLQGFYYTKPLPLESILERCRTGTEIGFENPMEMDYFETLGRINLNDLDWVMSDDFASDSLYNSIPMVIMELNDEAIRIVRSNKTYREFSERTFERNIGNEFERFETIPENHRRNFLAPMLYCAKNGTRMLVDEKFPNNTTVHTIIRRVASNPIMGTKAVAVAILSVTDDASGATYANVASSLAADYFVLFYVNTRTDEYIIYTPSEDNIDFMEKKRSKNFFTDGIKMATRIVNEEDREEFVTSFTKEKILKALEEEGRFALTHRINKKGKTEYVCIKAMPMSKDHEHIIIGVSNVDAQMKQHRAIERLKREQIVSSRICALVDNYLCMYTVNLEDETYVEVTSKGVGSEAFGFAHEGVNFFDRCREEAKRVVYEEDYKEFMKEFSREKVLETIAKEKIYVISYRMNYYGAVLRGSLKAATVKESDGEKLIIGLYLDE